MKDLCEDGGKGKNMEMPGADLNQNTDPGRRKRYVVYSEDAVCDFGPLLSGQLFPEDRGRAAALPSNSYPADTGWSAK